jgi:hypothetical protein
MQHGCMERLNRKRGPEVWQFRWSVTGPDGKHRYHKKIVGTVEHYPDEPAARRAVAGLLSEINTDGRPTSPRVMTTAQLCDHFEQRELSKENTWRSHATKKIYKAYLPGGFALTGTSMSWLRSEQYKSSPGFDACLSRRAVVPRFEI